MSYKKKMKPKKDKKSGLPKKYVPDSLTPSQKAKQVKSIKEKKDRPKLDVKTRRSKWTVKAEKYFGKGNTSIDNIAKKLKINKKGLQLIMDKGMGAYYSSGSRPNQTASSWGMGRIFSVLFGGNARDIDKDIVKKYKIPLLTI
jgi:hypothetical protein